jgi:hypothetical protein
MLQIKLAPPTIYRGVQPVADMKAYVTNSYHTPVLTGISKHGNFVWEVAYDHLQLLLVTEQNGARPVVLNGSWFTNW